MTTAIIATNRRDINLVCQEARQLWIDTFTHHMLLHAQYGEPLTDSQLASCADIATKAYKHFISSMLVRDNNSESQTENPFVGR